MKIKRIEIRDFRGIPSLELDFINPESNSTLETIVLAGPNGSGKTSILEAILLCLNCVDLLTNRPRVFNIKHSARNFHIKLEFDDPCMQPAEIRSDEHGETTVPLLSFTSPIAYFSSWRAPRLIGPVAITAGKPGRKPAEREENRLWRIKNYFVNLRARRAFFSQGTLFASERLEEEEALNRLADAWHLFYPDRQDRFEALAASKSIEEGFDLFLLRRKDNLQLAVDSLSSGELEVFTFLGSFLIEDFSNGLVLIDEPELHLHPSWHRVILRAIRSLLPNTQIIAATHSPQVLSEWPFQNIRLLQHDNGITLAKMPEDSFGLNTDRILEELMDTLDRPEEVKKQLQKLFDRIDRNDLEGARALALTIKEKIHDDPALTKAEMLIRKKEALSK